MKMRVRRLKILKLGVPKKTTTIRFGWTRDNNLSNLGENALDERGRGGDKTPEVRIPEVNIDRLMDKDVCRLICNFGRK
jgi:hypothetical protein